jgi:hypothetical protein
MALTNRTDFPQDVDVEILDFIDQSTLWETAGYDLEGLVVDVSY